VTRGRRTFAARGTPGRTFGALAATLTVVAVVSTTPTLGCVGDDDVGTLLGGRNEFETFVARVEGRGALGRHDRQHLDALHVLLDVGAVDVAHHGAARYQRGVEDTLRELGASGAPRRDVALQTGYFDVNAPRHRAPI
jgi:hypothetical protein